jgi:hypothetical protein
VEEVRLHQFSFECNFTDTDTATAAATHTTVTPLENDNAIEAPADSTTATDRVTATASPRGLSYTRLTAAPHNDLQRQCRIRMYLLITVCLAVTPQPLLY